jgi:predicted nucleic acid-binding protein
MSIVDASVVLKWFLQEDDQEKDDLLRQKHIMGEDRLIAPDLLLYEVSNATLPSRLFTSGD